MPKLARARTERDGHRLSAIARREGLMRNVFFLCAFTSIAAVLLICIFLFSNGISFFGKYGLLNFLSDTEWGPSNIPQRFGILPMILGSLYVTAGAVLIGVPIGVLTAIFLAEFCPRSLHRFLQPAASLMAGIPSVVYGFFGMVVIVPAIRSLFGGTGSSILAASALLGIMILPTVVGISESAMRAVPRGHYESARALGASRERSVFFIMLPAARSGILAAMVLGIGRAIGETMAVIMVAGNQARMPAGILKGVRTLTANIVLEMAYASDMHREALIATGVVLFVFILLINFFFSRLQKGGAEP